MVFITGDTHIPIDITKLNTKNFLQQKQMTKEDIVIICGDFGGVWSGAGEDKHWQKWLEMKSFTTCFVDGNHENFDLLNAYPTELWNGGSVHKIVPSVIHLMRGQMFNIQGDKYFTMGGAASHDKHLRKDGISWWSQELPSNDEYESALNNLDKNNWMVDYVISHCAPDSIQGEISYWFEHDKQTNFFESIKDNLTFKKWYFGHYHVDRVFQEKYFAVYDMIHSID